MQSLPGIEGTKETVHTLEEILQIPEFPVVDLSGFIGNYFNLKYKRVSIKATVVAYM